MKEETDSMMQFPLENMRMRFPHLFEGIFVLLNQNDLAKCREVNRFLQDSLDEKFWWIKKIHFQLEEIQCQLKNSYPEFNKDWRLVVTKTMPLHNLKKIQSCLVKFFNNIGEMKSRKQYLSPIIVLSAFGDVNLFKEISVKLNNVYPKSGNLNFKIGIPKGCCLLHIAALFGNLETLKEIVTESDKKNPLSKNCRCLLFHGAAHAASSGRLELFQYLCLTFEGVYKSCIQQVGIEWKIILRAILLGIESMIHIWVFKKANS